MADNPNPGAGPSPFSSPDLQSTLNQMGMGGVPGAKPGAGGGAGLPGIGGAPQPQKPPRSIGTPVQEAKYLGKDIGEGVVDFLPPILQSVLGIKSSDAPEEIARKKKMLQKYNQMNAEQQQMVQQRIREREAAAREEEEQKHRERAEAQNRSQDLAQPQGKRSGAGSDGGSNKARITKKLNDDRQKLSSAG